MEHAARRVGELAGVAIIGGLCWGVATHLGETMVVACILALVAFGVWAFGKITKR